MMLAFSITQVRKMMIEENDDEEIDVEETDFNENDDKENNDDDNLSTSSEGFKKSVAV